MKQEDKELLLKDLCARLPYGVKCAEIYPINDKFVNKWDVLKIGKFIEDGIFISNSEETYGYVSQIENIKPYLFPLSSMTEEQEKEFDQLIELELKAISDEIDHVQATAFEVDFYNKHHLDWRGLIPMGLAIDATGKNIY